MLKVMVWYLEVGAFGVPRYWGGALINGLSALMRESSSPLPMRTQHKDSHI